MPSEIEVIRAALKTNTEAYRKFVEMARDGKLGAFSDVGPDDPLTVVGSPDHLGVVGAIRVKCGCGIAIWLSPSTQEMLKGRGAAPTPIICAICFFKAMKERREEKVEN